MRNLATISRVVNNLTRSLNSNHVPATFLQSNLNSPVYVSSRTHLGYIPFEGRIGKQLSNHETFLVETRQINIQPVKKATFSFDPIREDYQSIRNFMYFFHKPKVLDTNQKIIIKKEILDDRSEPVITFELIDGRTLEIKTSKLTELEILRVMNYFLLPLVTEEKIMETKSAKGAGSSSATGGKGKKGGKKIKNS